LYFKRIDLQGFKSFADPVSIELNEGVTCIIGPNGSGKSNISDALRWVLGEQSSKQLRGSKMQDVIFAGTTTRKPRGMAEVSLVIDNSTGILPIEYNEVAVTRRMYRSGESEYLINGNQCRLRDIRELFMDTGIGVEGYSIIGQGKIADIVSTRPENRRRIFEEAAGVVLYKSRKADAETKLKSATDNIERVRDIIAEIEGRIDGLKEDSEKATEYIGLRDRYKSLGINIILHNLENLSKSVEDGRNELETLQDDLNKADSEMQLIEKKLASFRDNDSEYSTEYDEANQLLISKIDELNTITSGGKLNEERLINIEKDLVRISAELSDAQTKLDSERSVYDELAEKEKAMSSEMDALRVEHGEAVLKYTEDSKKASALSMQIDRLKDSLIDINNSNVNRNAEINTLGNYKKTLDERRESLSNDYKGQGEKDEENRQRLAEAEEKLKAKGGELAGVRGEIAELTDKVLSDTKEVSETSSRIDKLTAEINRATARKNTIEEMESNYEGYNNAVRTLMSSNLRGIIGTVSDLISVPDGYETAIETALGSSLQNIVCEDDDSAKTAVRMLKTSKAGRATFLPVSSITADRLTVDSRVLNADGFLGMASEMIKTDDRYREIADYLLCRVIVADNMDNAVVISKMKTRGFRIVTLDGEVVNSFGAITGGRYANKTANLLDRKKEINELSKTIDGYRKETEKLTDSRDKLNSGITKSEAEIETLRQKSLQLEIEYNVLRTDCDHAGELIENDKNAAERYASEIKTIEEDLVRADEMIEKYRNQIKEAEKEYGDTEQKVTELMKESEDFRNVIEEDNEAIVALKVRIGEQEAKALSQNELIERVRDTVMDLDNSVEEYKTQLAELENSKSLLTSSGEQSGEKESELRAEKEKLESRIEELSSMMETNRRNNEDTLRLQKEKNDSLEELRDRKYKLELKTAKNETLLDTQKEKLWDDFEVSYAEAQDMRDPDFAITAGNKESREIKLRMAELGDVNISAIEEYKQVSKRYEFMTAQEEDLSKAMKELREIISNMDKTIKTKFKDNFDQVVVNFEESFKELFGGGYAELRLEDESNPLESGIEITAQPPGKKLKNINLLSGGEKTLTAIALMFAVLKTKPTPFVILDEVEAALDEVNIERFSEYLKNFEGIQFALITHQKATMEHADVLYGVTMPEQGISKMLSLKLGDDFDVEGLE